MGPSGCGKTCLSKSLVLDHLDELFVNPANVIHYCYGALQDGFREMQEEGFKFHESVPEQGQLKKLLECPLRDPSQAPSRIYYCKHFLCSGKILWKCT